MHSDTNEIPSVRDRREAITNLHADFVKMYCPKPSKRRAVADALFAELSTAAGAPQRAKEGRAEGGFRVLAKPLKSDDLKLLVPETEPEPANAGSDTDELANQKPRHTVENALSWMQQRIRFFGHTQSQMQHLLTTFRASGSSSEYPRDVVPEKLTFRIAGRLTRINLFGPKHTGQRDAHFLIATFRSLADVRPTEPDEFPEVPEWTETATTAQKSVDDALLHLSAEQRPDHRVAPLLQVIEWIWRATYFDKVYAASLAAKDLPDDVAAVAVPICDIADRLPLSATTLERFFERLRELSSVDTDAARITSLLEQHVIRYLFRHQAVLLENSHVLALLRRRSESLSDGWRQFFIDVYFCVVADRVQVPHALLSLLGEIFESYRNDPSNADSPIPRLFDYFENAVQLVNTYTFEEVVESLISSARKCERAEEARWCLRAAQRILPMFGREADTFHLAETIRNIISKFRPGVDSSYFRFQFLRTELYHFMARRADSSRLLQFENRFIKLRSGLVPAHLRILQLEYASALFAARDTPSFSTSLFYQHVIGGDPPDTYILFRTTAFDMTRASHYVQRKGADGCIPWLETFAQRMFRLYVPDIQTDVGFANQFRCAPFVGRIREKLESILAPYLTSALEYQWSADEYARVLGLFRFVRLLPEYVEPRHEYLRRSIQADDYSVLLHSHAILITAHYSYFYGPKEIADDAQPAAHVVISRLAKLTGPQQRYAAAYWESIRFDKAPREHEFVDAMVDALSERRRSDIDPFQPSVLAEPMFHMLHDGLMSILLQHSPESAWARHLATYFDYGDSWNLLGTTVMRLGTENRTVFVNAATLYGIAAMISRAIGDSDVKARFNYIRCRSRSMLAAGQIDEEFLRKAAEYISDPVAQSFTYWEDALTTFFQLVRIHWRALPPSLHETLMTTLRALVSRGLLRSDQVPPEVMATAPSMG